MTSNLLSENFIQKVRTSTKILKAVDHPFRQRMIDLMEVYDCLNAEALSSLLGVKPSLVASHLDVMRREGIVHLSLEGKQYFYSVNYDMMGKINDFVNGINDTEDYEDDSNY